MNFPQHTKGIDECWDDIDGFVQDCINFSALAVELLQSYTKPFT